MTHFYRACRDPHGSCKECTTTPPSVEIPSERSSRAPDTMPSSHMPCIVCGLPVDMRSNPFVLHVCEGGNVAVDADPPYIGHDDAGCLGSYPVGSGCLRAHPQLRPFARRTNDPRMVL